MDKILENLAELKFYSPRDHYGDTAQVFMRGCQFIVALHESGEEEKAAEIFEWVREWSEQSEAWAREYDQQSISNNNWVAGYSRK